MWPFKKKKKKEAKVPTRNLFAEKQIELQTRIFKNYPAGKEIDYMGVTIRITGHRGFFQGFDAFGVSMATTFPGIRCDYINNNGEIVAASFSCTEVETWEKGS